MAVKLKFSPSHSYRWMNCFGALQLCAKLPVPPSSPSAMEGTAAHELAAACLKMDQDACEWIGETIEVEDKLFKVTEEMADNVQVYLNTIRKDMEENGIPLKELSVEKKFKIQCGENITGTNDASFSSPLGKLYVYDLKYGAGTYVEVVQNTQLMLYALGALEASGNINEEVEIVIVQPRYKNEDTAPVRRWLISAEDLEGFRTDVIVAVSKCHHKDAECTPGPWCGKTFCPAQGICPAMRKQVAEITGENKDGVLPEPQSLTPEQLSRVLKGSELVSDWIKAVRSYAESRAKDFGEKIPGYKLVQKFGNRAWIDEMAVEAEFEGEFGDRIYEKRLLSPAKLEKIVGKDRVVDLVEKPDRGVQLVREDAKGTEVTTDQVFEKLL